MKFFTKKNYLSILNELKPNKHMNHYLISLLFTLLSTTLFGQTEPTSNPNYYMSESGLILSRNNGPESNLEATNLKLSTLDTCILLKPNAANGKDAYINTVIAGPVGVYPSLIAARWTYAGTPGVGRSLIEFDLSSIPSIAIITSARMGLFWDPTGSHVGHSTSGGSNIGFICRVTSPWGEFSTTWLTQPSFTTVNQVTIPQSLGMSTDYPNIPVSNLIFDIWNNPATSHGFIIMLQTENVLFRSLRFASSDNANPALWPELEVCYSIPILETREITISGSTNYNQILLHLETTGSFIDGVFDLQNFDGNSWQSVQTNLPVISNRYDLALASYSPDIMHYRIRWTSDGGKSIYSNSVEIAASKSSRFEVFPNPCQDVLNIASSQRNSVNKSMISIWDANGRRIFESIVHATNTEIDVSRLAQGIYIVQLDGVRRRVYKQ